MSKLTLQKIKASKRFYVRTYRKLGSFLLFSVVFNIVLGVAVTYMYINIPERDYYATYGEIPPIELTALDTPNFSSRALLSDDRKYESDKREIPK